MANFIGYFSLCLNMPCPNIAFPTLPCTDSCLLKLVVRPRKIILFFRVQLYCVYLPITKHFVNSKFWNFEKTWPYFQKKTFNIKKTLKIRFWKSQNVTIFLSSRTTNAKLINHIAGWPWFWLTNRLRLHPLCRNFGRKRFSFFTHRKNFIPVES